MSPTGPKTLQTMSAADAFATAKGNKLRAYPSPERGGDRLYPLASPSAKPSFQMNKTDTVFTIGSCFARNVEAALMDVGLTVTSQETDLGPVGDSLGFTANFFNKYAIHSIYNDLKWALERDTDPGDAAIYPMHKDGMYADLQLGMPKLEFPIEDIRAFRNRYLDVMARAADADVIIITLGYVETWFDNELGVYLNTSPPQPMIRAQPDRFEFRVLSYNDVLQALHDVHALLVKHRTKPLKMLVTVSPVPLLATFRDMDVLVANAYSKSVQRAAIDEFIRDVEGVDYFPSYEFVILSDPNMAWSRKDYRHPNSDLVARIMSNVVAQYVEGHATPQAVTVDGLQASARMLYKQEDFEAVIALGAKHNDQFEQSEDLLVMLGNAHVKENNMQTAYETFEAAHALAPTKSAPLERLIRLCRPVGATERAAELLARHEVLFPERQNYRDKLG